ncbi:BPL-N domain-containing protein [Streptomyces sp. NPDC059883]|uniref:BPL-N domain-containing protein n=1 Tax=unclassified Streptomyces TaxID=2593676 RepID=UPI0036614232
MNEVRGGVRLPRDAPGRRRASSPALVYRGRTQQDMDCADAVAGLLSQGPWSLDVRTTGPRGELPLSSAALARARLYAQPGGGSLTPAYREMRRHTGAIRDFVENGGSYLGFCLGGYLAGQDEGFGLLSGEVDQYIVSPGATVRTEDDTLVEIDWRGSRRLVFFQDGPYFSLRPGPGTTVLARYPNDLAAALVTSYGAGRVAVVGPHPEATEDWFDDIPLPFQDTLDLAVDFAGSALDG